MANRKPTKKQLTAKTNIGTVTLGHKWWATDGRGLDVQVYEFRRGRSEVVHGAAVRCRIGDDDNWSVVKVRKTPRGALRAAINATEPMLSEAQKRALTRARKVGK